MPHKSTPHARLYAVENVYIVKLDFGRETFCTVHATLKRARARLRYVRRKSGLPVVDETRRARHAD